MEISDKIIPEQNQEMFKAYLSGKEVEYKGTSLDFAYAPWAKVISVNIFASGGWIFRLAYVKKVLKYNIVRSEDGGLRVITENSAGLCYGDQVLSKDWLTLEYMEEQ